MALLMFTLQVINVMSMENLTSYQIKHGGIKVKSKCLKKRWEFGIAGFTLLPLLLSFMLIGKDAK